VLDQLHGVDLVDLSKATPDQLAAAEQFAWGVKNLLFHLVVDGQAYLRTELKDQIVPAGLEIPRSAVLAAQREWMPHLLEEVTNHNNGIKPPLPNIARSTPTPAPAEKPTSSSDQSLLGGDDLTPAATPTPTPSPAGAEADLLGAGSADDLTAATPTPTPAAKANDDLTSGDGGDLVAGGTAAPTASSTPTPAVEPKSAEEWVAAGGWFRPQDSFTLYYRPVGHADPFLVAWLDVAAKLASRPAPAAASTIFRAIADPQAAGVCMKCHTVDTGAATQVNWLPSEALPRPGGFTTFRHTTHLSLFGNTACETCHSINPKADYAKYFSGATGVLADRDATHFESNFVPLSKAACVQCHQPKIAGDSCLLCHRYHAGPVPTEVAGKNKLQPLLSAK
jgi:hypothetical protein